MDIGLPFHIFILQAYTAFTNANLVEVPISLFQRICVIIQPLELLGGVLATRLTWTLSSWSCMAALSSALCLGEHTRLWQHVHYWRDDWETSAYDVQGRLQYRPKTHWRNAVSDIGKVQVTKNFDKENRDNADNIAETTTVSDLRAVRKLTTSLEEPAHSTTSENACQGNLLFRPWHLQTP